MTDLLPCPFCGGRLFGSNNPVTCLGCGASGPVTEYLSVDTPCQLWNQRTDTGRDKAFCPDMARYDGTDIAINEWPQPACEITDKEADKSVTIRTAEDARAVIESLGRFLEVMEKKA